MSRPKESAQAKREAVFRAITSMRTGDEMPTQEAVADHMGKSVRYVRSYWPKGAYVFGLIDQGHVGLKEDAEFSARQMEETGYGIRAVARRLGVDQTKARRLLKRR